MLNRIKSTSVFRRRWGRRISGRVNINEEEEEEEEEAGEHHHPSESDHAFILL